MSNPFFIFATFIVLILSFNSFSDDRELLKDLPPVTAENVRWNIAADAWRFDAPSYLMKGKLYKMEMHLLGEEYVYIYDNKKLSGEPIALHTSKSAEHKQKSICSLRRYRRDPFRRSIFECNNYSCHQLSEEKFLGKDRSHKDNPQNDSEYLTSRENIVETCPKGLDYYVKRHISNNDTNVKVYSYLYNFIDKSFYDFYFRYESIDKDRNYLEVKLNGKPHYIDIRGCKKNPKMCAEVNIEFSDYEKDWIALKKHQKNRDIGYLNVLIEELKPCVIRRDIPCIQKYFLNEEEKGDYYEYTNYVFPNIAADNEVLLKELEACLDYDKLLPHLMGTRGIDRVCIWTGRQAGPLDEKTLKTEQDKRENKILIMGVSFPEAVRISGADYPVYHTL